MSYDFEFTPEQLAHCLPQNKHPHELFDALAVRLALLGRGFEESHELGGGAADLGGDVEIGRAHV